jgi:hypothetical protein
MQCIPAEEQTGTGSSLVMQRGYVAQSEHRTLPKFQLADFPRDLKHKHRP